MKTIMPARQQCKTDFLFCEFKRQIADVSDQALKNLESNYANDQKKAARQKLAAIRKEQERRKKEAAHAST
jgi:hypothetical protein